MAAMILQSARTLALLKMAVVFLTSLSSYKLSKVRSTLKIKILLKQVQAGQLKMLPVV